MLGRILFFHLVEIAENIKQKIFYQMKKICQKKFVQKKSSKNLSSKHFFCKGKSSSKKDLSKKIRQKENLSTKLEKKNC